MTDFPLHFCPANLSGLISGQPPLLMKGIASC